MCEKSVIRNEEKLMCILPSGHSGKHKTLYQVGVGLVHKDPSKEYIEELAERDNKGNKIGDDKYFEVVYFESEE